MLRNILDYTPKHLKEEIHSQLKAILHAPNPETARKLLKDTLNKYSDKAKQAMDVLEKGFENSTAVLELPQYYRKRLRTTKALKD